jgi:hypothetical protein
MRCPTLGELPLPPPGTVGWPWTEENTQLPDNMPDGSPWPWVSIVTPSYNQAQFVEETIRSVLLQGYPNVEYIIIDGGSTDGTVEIIRKYERWLAYWVSERDRGQSDAINKGLARTRGEILAWLNSDDCYLSGCMSMIVAAFAQHPKAGVVYGRIEQIDEQGRRMKVNSAHYCNLPYTFADQLTQQMIIPQQAAFWRREVMDTVGPLRTDLHYAMDFEFWIRIGRHYPIISTSHVLAQYRFSDVNKGGAQGWGWGPEFIDILDDLYADPDLPKEILSLKRKAYAGAYYIGGRAFLTAFDVSTAQAWLRHAVRLSPSYLRSIEWWLSFLRTLMGKRIYGWGRMLKAKLRDGRRQTSPGQ